jgi:tRNA threonylcarbamoyl adenosine modification protein YeaZ
MPIRILAVDTALGACSAAVLEGDVVRSHRFVAMERGHAEALAPMVEEVMRESGLAFADLDRLAVTTGPGTFTGQRVGIAFMRGLRIALKKPLAGITTLDAMAAAAMAEVRDVARGRAARCQTRRSLCACDRRRLSARSPAAREVRGRGRHNRGEHGRLNDSRIRGHRR